MSQNVGVRFGRFELLERLGTGGMGEVFRANMLGPDGFVRQIALKRMLRELDTEPEALRMFIDEARLVARLIHPHIAQVYDFGKVDGQYFLVMEWIDGCDLARLVTHLGEQSRTVSLGITTVIIAALLEALAYAHQVRDSNETPLGLVHRDLSPSNILLSKTGEIKLTDFGIAKTRDRMVVTREGKLRGKIPYMSPEQASGMPLDQRSDLFSLGVILYQLATGRRPFRGVSTAQVLANVISGVYPPPQTLNAHLGPGMLSLISTALATKPEDRPVNAGEFRTLLLAAAARDGVQVDLPALRAEVLEVCSARPPAALGPTRVDRNRRSSTEESGPSNVGAASTTSRDPRGLLALLGPGLIAVVATALTLLVVGIALRPSGLAGGHPPVVRVALRMFPAQRDWFRREVFDSFEREFHCKVETVEFEAPTSLVRVIENHEADLIKVDTAHAPVLVDQGLLARLPELGRRTDAEAFAAVTRALRPEAIDLGTFKTSTGPELYLLARKLETAMFGYRPSMVKLAVDEFAAQRAALDGRLRSTLGQGLPKGFVLSPAVDQWTTWDVLAAAWVWAHVPIQGHLAPRYLVRIASFPLELISAGAPEGAVWSFSPAMVNLFEFYALLEELGLLHPESGLRRVDDARELLAHLDIGGFITNQIDIGILAGNDHGLAPLIHATSDLDVAPIPRLVGLDEGSTVLSHRQVGVVGWGWGVARTAAQPELAMKLALAVLSHDRHGAEVEAFPILRVRKDVHPVWPLSKRVNEVGDAQLADHQTTVHFWPTGFGEAERREQMLANAFRQVVLERRYRGEKRVDRRVIEQRLLELVSP